MWQTHFPNIITRYVLVSAYLESKSLRATFAKLIYEYMEVTDFWKTICKPYCKWKEIFHTLSVWSESSVAAFWIAKGSKFLDADNEHSDDNVRKRTDITARKRKLIWVFAGRTCQKVRFLTIRLRSVFFFFFFFFFFFAHIDVIYIWIFKQH